VSVETTNIYAEVDMEMKAKALASVDISVTTSTVFEGGSGRSDRIG